VFAATRVRGGQRRLHAGLMVAGVAIELAVFSGFTFLMAPGPRRSALAALPFFKVHVTFAVAAFAGMAWQLASRAVPRWRRLHRQTGPYVVLVWCLALLTGIYNYLFLYVMRVT
jgi:uncharacterized membrane protein YozB (DUF420 family)